MAIDRVQVRNFQRLGEMKVSLDPEVTAITGPTDAGKSSLLRSIRWVAENRPTGDGFVKDGSEGGADVSLRVDGIRVRRKKNGAKENSYRVGDKVLKAFKTDVPDEVKDLLKTGPVNFQGQMDPPFWFSLNPAEVARQINSIVDLDRIDQVMGWLKAEARKAKAAEDAAVGMVEEAGDRLRALEWVSGADADLQEIEAAEDEAEALGSRYKALEALVSSASDWEARARAAEGLGKDLEVLEESLEALKSASKSMAGIRSLIGKAEDLAWEVEESSRKAGDVRRLLSEFKRCPLCGGELP